jgi:hypothetical protein
MNKALESALVTMAITIGTSLMALFSQDGVQTFAEIAQTSYASAVLGGLVAGFTAYKARQAEPE